VTWLLTLAGLAIALLGFVGTEWLTEYSKAIALVPLYDRLPRLIRDVPAAHGAIGGFHPNEVAGVLAVLTPAGIACTAAEVLARRGGLGRLRAGVAVAALVAMAVYLLVSVSRGAWLGAGVGILAMLVAYAPRAALRLSPVVVVAGAVVALVARQRVSQALMASDLTWSSGAWDRPTRFEIWQRALQMIGDHPWTGVGLNAFPYVVQARYPFVRHTEFLVPHAHNLFLQTAVDYGLPGLVCLAVLLAGGFTGAVRVLRSSGERAWRLPAAGVVGALAACATFGLLDAVAIGAKPTFLQFAVVAVGVCAGESVWWPGPGRSGYRLDGSAVGWPDSSGARST
jgi:putative inorganic carbon (HCO3(-)) transporter